MNTRVDTAVANNIVWCGIVCETHGVPQASREWVWGLLSPAPPFYPDIITSSRNAAARDVLDFAEDRAILSIKDSFANLDMAPFGFKVLFEAEWIYHEPIANVHPDQTTWTVVSSETDLALWTAANGLQDVIKPDLLKRSDVSICMRETNGELAGFIANLGAGAVGISNVFSKESVDASMWSDIANVVSAEFPGLAMVGYEHGEALAAALESGWTSIGPLRVWIRSE